MRACANRFPGFPTSAISTVVVTLAVWTAAAEATAPPRESGQTTRSIEERFENFATKRGLTGLTRRIALNRGNVTKGRMSFFAAQAAGGLQIRGVRSIPVLMVKYANSGDDPYPVADLQRQLFDGPWPTGTMTDYYREVSYGTFTVTGRVQPWRKVEHDDDFYEGEDGSRGPCRGICENTKVGDLLTETFGLNDADVDFTLYDNDGPDNVPNSGDDDGFVDFVAVVQPETGGECSEENRNIWSHRFSYADLTGANYETEDEGANGEKIRIDDYVITPAWACDGSTMIQIGVFAHEFGHAFGLPDLYDTDDDNGKSEGIGSWGLMGSGSWGGDNSSPHLPTHMSAWEKDFLGWLRPTTLGEDLTDGHLHPVEQRAEAYKIDIGPNDYYLIEYRRQIGFDRSLTGSGLLVWKINRRVVDAGLRNNRVNADETRKGVALIEADDLGHLDSADNRGDFGDMFRGSEAKLLFDRSTRPASLRGALCAIGEAEDTNSLQVLFTKLNCP